MPLAVRRLRKRRIWGVSFARGLAISIATAMMHIRTKQPHLVLRGMARTAPIARGDLRGGLINRSPAHR